MFGRNEANRVADKPIQIARRRSEKSSILNQSIDPLFLGKIEENIVFTDVSALCDIPPPPCDFEMLQEQLNQKIEDKNYSDFIPLLQAVNEIQQYPEDLQSKLELLLQTLHEKKAILVQKVKGNYQLQKDLDELDTKIRLLIRNRLSLEEVVRTTNHLLSEQKQTTVIPPEKKKLFGGMFFILQQRPEYLSRLTKILKVESYDIFIQVVVLTLYGDQYDSSDERLLLAMFQNVLETEFQETETNLGSFMRSNSITTQMLSTYSRRPGSIHGIKDVLGPLIDEIIDSESLEVNPLKVYLEIINNYETQTGTISPLPRDISFAEALTNHEVQLKVSSNIQKIQDFVTRILHFVLDSVDHLLYGVRWICRQLRQMTEKYFTEATPEQINSVVGGFLFLRFLNPIIVTPEVNSIRTEKPSKVGRRNLTLIAKVLQNLSNGIAFGDKEEFMASLNPFLDQTKPLLAQLFDRIIDVEDLTEALEMDSYLLLKTVDLLRKKPIVITYNEIVQMHRLVYENKATVIPNTPGDDPLLQILARLGPPLDEVPRSENSSTILDLEALFEDTDIIEHEGQIVRKRTQATRLSVWDRHAKKSGQSDVPLLPMPNIGIGLPTLFDEDSTNNAWKQTKIVLAQVLRQIFFTKEDIDSIVPPLTLLKYLEKGLEIAAKVNQPILATQCRTALRKIQSLFESIGSPYIEGLLVQEVYEAYTEMAQSEVRVTRNLAKLDRALIDVEAQENYLQESVDAYTQYLQNLRNENYSSTTELQAKAKSNKTKKKKAKDVEVKFTLKQLKDKQVILNASIPSIAEKTITFTFTRNESMTGTIDILGSAKGIISETIHLNIEDLLEEQHRGTTEIVLGETVPITLNLNMLMHLIGEHFN